MSKCTLLEITCHGSIIGFLSICRCKGIFNIIAPTYIADLTSDLQLFLSWGLTFMSFNSRQSFSNNFFHSILGLSGHRINLYITCCSDGTIRMLNMPIPVKHSLSQNEVKILKLILASCSLDLKVATSSSMILQICQIMALLLCCKLGRFHLVNGQVSLAWGIAL